MHAPSWLLATTMALAIAAYAQATGPADRAVCAAEQAAVEQEMETARAKGQMLRRRQLAETLAALQARCDQAPDESRAATIQRLEQHIRKLRDDLDQAEEQLRKLRSEAG